MTAALAAFARSDNGRFYADVCERFGVDPGAAIDDDVLAFQLRAALAVMAAKRADDNPDRAMERWMKESEGGR